MGSRPPPDVGGGYLQTTLSSNVQVPFVPVVPVVLKHSAKALQVGADDAPIPTI